LPVEHLDRSAWTVLSGGRSTRHSTASRMEGTGMPYRTLSVGPPGVSVTTWWSMTTSGTSLIAHHDDRVEASAHAAQGDLVVTRQQLRDRHPHGPQAMLITDRPRYPRRRRRFVPSFMVGWPTWFENRRVGLHDKRFRLITRSAYRGQPKICTNRRNARFGAA
jgi:hypothetical protein